MDLSAINDIVQLKALAYEQMCLHEQTGKNVAMIKQRIAELTIEQMSNIDQALPTTPPLPPSGTASDSQTETPTAPADNTNTEQTDNGQGTGA